MCYLCFVAGLCSTCNQHDGFVCIDCSIGFKQLCYYCTKCSWHQHQINHEHKHDLSDVHTGRTLQLLSVLCIETSHYVCFTRITGSSGKDEWVFFDSMAERQGKDNHNSIAYSSTIIAFYNENYINPMRIRISQIQIVTNAYNLMYLGILFY